MILMLSFTRNFTDW